MSNIPFHNKKPHYLRNRCYLLIFDLIKFFKNVHFYSTVRPKAEKYCILRLMLYAIRLNALLSAENACLGGSLLYAVPYLLMHLAVLIQVRCRGYKHVSHCAESPLQ